MIEKWWKNKKEISLKFSRLSTMTSIVGSFFSNLWPFNRKQQKEEEELEKIENL